MQTETINLQQLLPVVEGWAREAGAIHFSYFRKKDLAVDTKANDYDVVTKADKESERLIISRIKERFPRHSILAEESGESSGGDRWQWVIDPLDGTTNFSQGLPLFCVSIALQYDGVPQLGVVFAPYLDEMYSAVRGCGATLNGKPVNCPPKNRLAEAVVTTGLPVSRHENPDNNLDNFARVAVEVRGVRLRGSAALDLCYTAAGFLDGFWEMDLHLWGIAAGALIAEEAGADVVYFRPERPYSILVASPALTPQLSALIR